VERLAEKGGQMQGFEIASIETAAKLVSGEGLQECALIKLSVLKGFDFKKNSDQVIKKLQAALELIGRTD
jgi:hypothetical protein